MPVSVFKILVWNLTRFVGQRLPAAKRGQLVEVYEPVLFNLCSKDRTLRKVRVSGVPLMMKRVVASPTQTQKI
jgi:hypothetical protein